MESKQRISDLLEENRKLKERLLDFKKLEEELLVDKVFKSAKDKLIRWYTIGGIGVFLVGIWGINFMVEYMKNAVTEKINKISEDQIQAIMMQKSEEQIKIMIKGQEKVIRSRLDEFVKLKTTEIQIVTSPIGSPSNSTASYEVKYNDSPGIVNLLEKDFPVSDQGTEGSGVGFALADALSMSYRLRYNKKIRFSARYIYNSINGGFDRGAVMEDGLELLVRRGVVEDKDWPYVPGEFSQQPSQKVSESLHYKIKNYKRLRISEQDIKLAISQHKPVITGIVVYKETPLKGGETMKSPPGAAEVIGYQPFIIVGYDDSKRLFKIMGSWGPSWSIDNTAYLKYDDLKERVRSAFIMEI